MNLLCRIFGHRWEHDHLTAYVCARCHKRGYGMGGYDKHGEYYRPPTRYRITNGKRERI